MRDACDPSPDPDDPHGDLGIIRRCLETAEAAYLRARAAGRRDPVVCLLAIDLDDPGLSALRAEAARRGAEPMAFRCAGRAVVARLLDELGRPGAAGRVRTPPPGRRLTVVIADEDGLSVHHRPAPGAGDGAPPPRRPPATGGA